MEESSFAGAAQRVGQGLRLLRDDVETEDLDGYQTVAGGLIGPEDRAKGSHANLMQHSKWTERRRRNVSAGIVSSQWTESEC